MADIIQIRRDTAANWTTNNPVLANGELGIETDTKKAKFGNGVDDWNSLDYWFEDAAVNWGDIGGTLSNQTDLQNALDGKAETVHTHVENDITDLDKYTQAEVDALIAAIDAGWKISATAPTSPDDGDGWLNTSNGLLYIYDSGASKWLSVDREVFIFNRNGTVTNGYLKIGETLNADVGYKLIRNGTVVAVVASGTGGTATKEIQLQDDGTPILTFNLSGYDYKNETLDIDLSDTSNLQAFVTDENGMTGSWYDSNYLYRKTITIDQTKIPGTSNLTDFIVSLDLTDGDLTKARADGYDIIFVADDDTTPLEFERVYFDQSTGELVAHVKIPTVAYNADTEFYMYYGNSGAASDPADPATLWADHIAVWHFQEQITGSGDTVADATGNGNTANSVGMDPSDWIDGRFGKAHDFTNAGGDYYDVTDGSLSDINGRSEIQVMCLFRVDAVPHGDDAAFFNRGNNGNSPQLMLGLDGGSNPIQINTRVDLTGGFEREDDSGVGTGWHTAVLRYQNGDALRSYADGAQIGNHTASGTINTQTSPPARIARRLFSDTRGLEDIVIDELRIKKTVTTAEFIEAEANNLLNQSTFVAFGLEENYIPPTNIDNPIIQVIVAWRA